MWVAVWVEGFVDVACGGACAGEDEVWLRVRCERSGRDMVPGRGLGVGSTWRKHHMLRGSVHIYQVVAHVP